MPVLDPVLEPLTREDIPDGDVLPPGKLPPLIGMPGLNDELGYRIKNLYGVRVFNDEEHSFPQVEMILQYATGCSLEKAQRHAEAIHTRGEDIVFTGEYDDCVKVSKVISRIDLKVDVVEI